MILTKHLLRTYVASICRAGGCPDCVGTARIASKAENQTAAPDRGKDTPQKKGGLGSSWVYLSVEGGAWVTVGLPPASVPCRCTPSDPLSMTDGPGGPDGFR